MSYQYTEIIKDKCKQELCTVYWHFAKLDSSSSVFPFSDNRSGDLIELFGQFLK